MLIENGGGGSEFAAPVARQIIDYYLLEGHAGIDLKLATRGDR